MSELGGRFSRENQSSSGRDLILFASLLALCFMGLLILYSASSVISQRLSGDVAFIIKRQAGWLGLGVGGLFLAALIPLPLLRKLALPSVVFSLVLLGLVFVPGVGHAVVSKTNNSFHRWLEIGPFTMQPSEFAKVAIVVFLASVLAREERFQKEFDIKAFAPPLGLVGLVLLAIVLEPQFGTTVCLLGVVGAMIFISGFPALRLGLIFLSSLPLLYLLIRLAPYRFSRIRVWLDPFAFRHEGGYQLVTAFRAFREGQYTGQELARGFAHKYLTYGHTDFVLPLFGEDYGLAGITVLFLLFLLFLWRGYMVVRKVRDPFAFTLGAGVLCMLFFQALLNIFVVTGLLPTTGVSLPFISYGGSSLIVSMIFGGLLVNVSAYRDV